jgi:hypothetical protein
MEKAYLKACEKGIFRIVKWDEVSSFFHMHYVREMHAYASSDMGLLPYNIGESVSLNGLNDLNGLICLCLFSFFKPIMPYLW